MRHRYSLGSIVNQLECLLAILRDYCIVRKFMLINMHKQTIALNQQVVDPERQTRGPTPHSSQQVQQVKTIMASSIAYLFLYVRVYIYRMKSINIIIYFIHESN